MKKVRKPRKIATEWHHAYVHNDSIGKHIDVAFQSASIKETKRLQVWLTKALAYLEVMDKKGR